MEIINIILGPPYTQIIVSYLADKIMSPEKPIFIIGRMFILFDNDEMGIFIMKKYGYHYNAKKISHSTIKTMYWVECGSLHNENVCQLCMVSFSPTVICRLMFFRKYNNSHRISVIKPSKNRSYGCICYKCMDCLFIDTT
jgi:hypothetical protein